MTTIKASCPACGDVELTPPDMTLMVCSHAPLSYYAFTCQDCHDEIRKPADDHVISLLMSGGVKATVWEIPEEALERHDGPPLTSNDVCDLIIELYAMPDDALAARAGRALDAWPFSETWFRPDTAGNE